MWRALDLYKGHPDWKIIKKSELTFEKAKALKAYSDKVGIEFFCRGFYPEAVEFLESMQVKRYKLASRTCTLKDPYSLETITKISDFENGEDVNKYLEVLFGEYKNLILVKNSSFELEYSSSKYIFFI